MDCDREIMGLPLGSKFTIYMDNNPLAYIKESKLGVAQIRWFRGLVLFDFDIKYKTGNHVGFSFYLSSSI